MNSEILPVKPSQNFLKLRKKLIGLTGKAIMHYNMIEQSDKVMVCMSGGKDSYTMLMMLLALKRRAPINFDIIAVNLDQKQPNFPEDVLPNYFKSHDIPYEIINEDTYSIVKSKIPEGKTTCSLCSRLRRGILYKVAKRLGATKIALGHHKTEKHRVGSPSIFFVSSFSVRYIMIPSCNSKYLCVWEYFQTSNYSWSESVFLHIILYIKC